MSGDGMWDAQKAVYEVLTDLDPELAGGRIYDHSPQTVTFPWVEIGTSIAEEQDIDGFWGVQEIVTIDVWSRVEGQREIKDIMSRIKSALHKATLTVPGRDARSWWNGSITLKDPDGITSHGVIRIRISSYASE